MLAVSKDQSGAAQLVHSWGQTLCVWLFACSVNASSCAQLFVQQLVVNTKSL